jgi:ribose/xylose/arabinose/galactoside ABC-type transport system permease subunit
MTLCIASKHFDQSIASMMAFLACVLTSLLASLTPRIGSMGIAAAVLAVFTLSVILG